MPELTHKQRLFVEAYLGPSNGNATDAARRAGYAWPDKQGDQLLGKPWIRAAVDARLDETALTTSQILARLSSIASSDIGDFLRIEGNGAWRIDLYRAKRRGLTPLIKKVKATEYGTEIELHSPMDALEKLGRYRGMWKADKQQEQREYDVDLSPPEDQTQPGNGPAA